MTIFQTTSLSIFWYQVTELNILCRGKCWQSFYSKLKFKHLPYHHYLKQMSRPQVQLVILSIFLHSVLKMTKQQHSYKLGLSLSWNKFFIWALHLQLVKLELAVDSWKHGLHGSITSNKSWIKSKQEVTLQGDWPGSDIRALNATFLTSYWMKQSINVDRMCIEIQ